MSALERATLVAQLHLPAVAASAHVARRFIRQVLQGWPVPGDLHDTVVLLTSELVGNAVRHTGQTVAQQRNVMRKHVR